MIRNEEATDTTQNNKSAMYPNKNNERTNKGSTSSNSSTSSTPQTPESIAKDKLVIYVYEYLQHHGATRAAQTFLSEIQWEKNITLGDPPGFLQNWWCVFWDLYSAAPERQEPNNHTPEAKAFHDLNSGNLPSTSYIPPPPGGDMSNMGLPSYFPRAPSLGNSQGGMPGMMPGPFMNSRYNAGRAPSLRMPNQVGGSYQNMQGSSLMSPAAAMRNFSNGMGPVPPNYSRLPNMANGNMMGGNPMGPSMPMGPRNPWNNPPQPSPLTPVPRTSIISSPQGDPQTPVSIMSPFGMKPPDAQIPISENADTLEEIPTEAAASAEIQRIKESMKEEVKKFESENNHVPEYYNMH